MMQPHAEAFIKTSHAISTNIGFVKLSQMIFPINSFMMKFYPSLAPTHVNSLTSIGAHKRQLFNTLWYCSFLPNFYPFTEFDSALNA